jgi:hypothetical protein
MLAREHRYLVRLQELSLFNLYSKPYRIYDIHRSHQVHIISVHIGDNRNIVNTPVPDYDPDHTCSIVGRGTRE